MALLGVDHRMHTAVVAMYMLLGDMYGKMFEEGALQAPKITEAFHTCVCTLYKLAVARCNNHYSGYKALWAGKVFRGFVGGEEPSAQGHLVLFL